MIKSTAIQCTDKMIKSTAIQCGLQTDGKVLQQESNNKRNTCKKEFVFTSGLNLGQTCVRNQEKSNINGRVLESQRPFTHCCPQSTNCIKGIFSDVNVVHTHPIFIVASDFSASPVHTPSLSPLCRIFTTAPHTYSLTSSNASPIKHSN